MRSARCSMRACAEHARLNRDCSAYSNTFTSSTARRIAEAVFHSDGTAMTGSISEGFVGQNQAYAYGKSADLMPSAMITTPVSRAARTIASA